MKKHEVEIGKVYEVKMDGVRTQVLLLANKSGGGWIATNLRTGNKVTVLSPQKLRRELEQDTLPPGINRPSG